MPVGLQAQRSPRRIFAFLPGSGHLGCLFASVFNASTRLFHTISRLCGKFSSEAASWHGDSMQIAYVHSDGGPVRSLSLSIPLVCRPLKNCKLYAHLVLLYRLRQRTMTMVGLLVLCPQACVIGSARLASSHPP